jgi:hypothetical protein
VKPRLAIRRVEFLSDFAFFGWRAYVDGIKGSGELLFSPDLPETVYNSFVRL